MMMHKVYPVRPSPGDMDPAVTVNPANTTPQAVNHVLPVQPRFIDRGREISVLRYLCYEKFYNFCAHEGIPVGTRRFYAWVGGELYKSNYSLFKRVTATFLRDIDTFIDECTLKYILNRIVELGFRFDLNGRTVLLDEYALAFASKPTVNTLAIIPARISACACEYPWNDFDACSIEDSEDSGFDEDHEARWHNRNSQADLMKVYELDEAIRAPSPEDGGPSDYTDDDEYLYGPPLSEWSYFDENDKEIPPPL